MDAYKREKDEVLIICSAITIAVIWPWHKKLIFWIAYLVLVLISSIICIYILKKIKYKSSRLAPENWEKMSGLEFESQVAIWLKGFYSQVSFTEYYDSGIDLIAAKAGEVVGVQVKRSSNKVGVAAVRAAVAGLSHYGCSKAMVITNSAFTNAAIKLAHENSCLLIDGNELRRNIDTKRFISSNYS